MDNILECKYCHRKPTWEKRNLPNICTVAYSFFCGNPTCRQAIEKKRWSFSFESARDNWNSRQSEKDDE